MFNFDKYNHLNTNILKFNSVVVGIHIRLGDYISKYKDIFNSVVNWDLDPNIIINNIINIYINKFTNVKFLVFSDEIELCQKILTLDNLNYNILKNDSYDDMFMLSNVIILY